MNTKGISEGRKSNPERRAAGKMKCATPACRRHGSGAPRIEEAAPAGTEWQTTAAALHYVFEDSMETMARGDIVLLDGTMSLREVVDAAFCAILSCPRCGKLVLLTQSQCSGTETVICGYDDCACHFRIREGRAIDYLPVN